MKDELILEKLEKIQNQQQQILEIMQDSLNAVPLKKQKKQDILEDTPQSQFKDLERTSTIPINERKSSAESWHDYMDLSGFPTTMI